MVHLPFASRAEAGRLLAAEVALHKFAATPIVLALPRGGVPVGSVVAAQLHAPLDVVVVRKLGVPWEPELAMGAMAGSFCILNEQLIRELGIADAEVERIVAREQAEIERREKLYRGGRPAPGLRDRDVILVDDGLATGSTMLAAVRYVRSLSPASVMIAIPVGAVDSVRRLREEADDFLCLATPDPISPWPTGISISRRSVTPKQCQMDLPSRSIRRTPRRVRFPQLPKRAWTGIYDL
jgi:predicted phosphoribosyltransferase